MRVCTQQQNAFNRRHYQGKKYSKYKGLMFSWYRDKQGRPRHCPKPWSVCFTVRELVSVA